MKDRYSNFCGSLVTKFVFEFTVRFFNFFLTLKDLSKYGEFSIQLASQPRKNNSEGQTMSSSSKKKLNPLINRSEIVTIKFSRLNAPFKDSFMSSFTDS